MQACLHIHACTHTYIHTYIHACIHTYMYTYLYVPTYLPTYLPACLPACLPASLPTYIHIYIDTQTMREQYIHACLRSIIGLFGVHSVLYGSSQSSSPSSPGSLTLSLSLSVSLTHSLCLALSVSLSLSLSLSRSSLDVRRIEATKPKGHLLPAPRKGSNQSPAFALNVPGDQGDVGDPGPTGDAPETPKPLAGLDLPLVSREWKNGSNSSYNCTPFLHSLLTKGRLKGLGVCHPSIP